MASTDAKAIPQKNVALRITFPIFDADGDLVTGATGLDSEISKDGATFADCTNEATEIATSSGMYFLDLTSTEMNADTVAIIVKTSTVGAKTTPIVLYTAARSINDLAYPTTTGRSIDVTATGEVGLDFANVAGTLTSSVVTSVGTAASVTGAVGSVTGAVGSVATGGITAASLAADAITAAKIADGAIDAATFATGAINAAAIATDAITAAKIAADAIGASELATDAVAEIAAAIWDLTTAGHATAGTFGAQAKTLIDAIKAKTDNLPAAPAAVSDIPTAATIADAVLDDPIPEPTGVHAWPATLRNIAALLGALQRNKVTQTATTTTVRNDADSATILTRAVADDGTTLTVAEAS